MPRRLAGSLECGWACPDYCSGRYGILTAFVCCEPNWGQPIRGRGSAKTRCPADTVVWVNLSSKVYHYRGYKDYGTTKKGAYMCEKDATAQGNRSSKIEKHPS
jgi:hypothetical protein